MEEFIPSEEDLDDLWETLDSSEKRDLLNKAGYDIDKLANPDHFAGNPQNETEED